MKRIRALKSVLITLLCSAFLAPLPAMAITIHEFVGDIQLVPTEFSGLDTVRHALNVNGTLHIGGWVGSQAAVQTVDLATGTVNPVQLFSSISGASNPTGGIQGIITTSSGSIEYLGRSMSPQASQNGPGEATIWTDASNPTGLGFAGLVSTNSIVFDGTADGTYVGRAAGTPVFGSAEGMVTLPFTDHGAAIAISDSGEFIVGRQGSVPTFWQEQTPGGQDYVRMDGLLETPEDAVLSGRMWQVIDSIAFGDYLDVSTFSMGVAAWDLNTGAVLQDFGLGEFAAAELIDGQIVVGINGLEGGRLSLLGDPSSLLLSDLLPPELDLTSITIVHDGLFQGSLGILIEGTDVGGTSYFATSYQTVPEPATFVMMLGMLPFVLMFRKRFAGRQLPQRTQGRVV